MAYCEPRDNPGTIFLICLLTIWPLGIMNLPAQSSNADDTTLPVEVFNNEIDLSQEVVNQFFSWTQDNAMACNPKKCNELILCKKDAHDIYPVNNLTQVSCLIVYASSIPELTTLDANIFRTKLTYTMYQKKQIAHYSRRPPVCPATLCTLPSPKRKKVQRTSEFLAVNSLGLIPRVLKIVFLIGYFSNIEQLFNVTWILNVKFNASTWNFLSLVILSAVFNLGVLGFQHVFLFKKQ